MKTYLSLPSGSPQEALNQAATILDAARLIPTGGNSQAAAGFALIADLVSAGIKAAVAEIGNAPTTGPLPRALPQQIPHGQDRDLFIETAYKSGKTLREIGDLLGCSPNAIHNNIERQRNKGRDIPHRHCGDKPKNYRNEQIKAAYVSGDGLETIAKRFGISSGRVCEILRNFRKNGDDIGYRFASNVKAPTHEASGRA